MVALWQPAVFKQETAEPLPAKFEPWHVSHELNPFTAFAEAPCWVGADHPAGCPACAWQSVPLKQPGEVPTGAGGDGGLMGELLPFKWHWAQTTALPVLVLEWVYVPVAQDVGCGALPPWQDEQATDEMPPEKSLPWHSWQAEKPSGWVFTDEPCPDGKSQPVI